MSEEFKELAPRDDAEQKDSLNESELNPGSEDALTKPNGKTKKKAEKSGGFKKIFDPDSLSGLTAILFLITAVVALLLGAVNTVTEPLIAERQREAAAESMRLVLPADTYDQIENTNLYQAKTDGKLVGFTSMVSPAGYGGSIVMMVGIDLTGQVTGVDIISHSETPGLGSKAKTEPWFLEQFIGKSSSVQLGSDDVDAISGSTITSAAVTKGVQEAVLNVMRHLNGESGGAK